MAIIETPLIILRLASCFAIVIMFHSYLVMGKTAGFLKIFFWVFNPSGLIYLTVGIQEENLRLLRGGLFLVAVSYGILIAFTLDDYDERKRYEKK